MRRRFFFILGGALSAVALLGIGVAVGYAVDSDGDPPAVEIAQGENVTVQDDADPEIEEHFRNLSPALDGIAACVEESGFDLPDDLTLDAIESFTIEYENDELSITINGERSDIDLDALRSCLEGVDFGFGMFDGQDGRFQFELPEDFDFELPENFELPEGFDFELPENFELPEGFDFELPDSFDSESLEEFRQDLQERFEQFREEFEGRFNNSDDGADA